MLYHLKFNFFTLKRANLYLSAQFPSNANARVEILELLSSPMTRTGGQMLVFMLEQTAISTQTKEKKTFKMTKSPSELVVTSNSAL
jgi:hypothetical protein